MKLETLFKAARKYNASDIHVVAGLPLLFRVNGDIITAKGDPVSPEVARSLAYERLNDDQKAILEQDWQLCFAAMCGQKGRARVTIYFRNGCPELAIRMTMETVPSREELALPAVVDDLAKKPNGLVIITGPTGVGKTTTLHYMLDLINSERRCKIITIEDPIEFVHGHKRGVVIQQEVLTDVHDFSSALVHVLRQDPDIIGIGEMRDPETMYTALMAAETGHLVISTLHTPSATDVLYRIVSAFPEGGQHEVRHMLANTIQGVVAQQLLPRAGKEGRIVCCEVLVGTNAVRHQIRDENIHQLYSEMQAGQKHDMITMDRALLDLYRAGEITYDAALSMARHPETIKKRMA